MLVSESDFVGGFLTLQINPTSISLRSAICISSTVCPNISARRSYATSGVLSAASALGCVTNGRNSSRSTGCPASATLGVEVQHDIFQPKPDGAGYFVVRKTRSHPVLDRSRRYLKKLGELRLRERSVVRPSFRVDGRAW